MGVFHKVTHPGWLKTTCRWFMVTKHCTHALLSADVCITTKGRWTSNSDMHFVCASFRVMRWPHANQRLIAMCVYKQTALNSVCIQSCVYFSSYILEYITTQPCVSLASFFGSLHKNWERRKPGKHLQKVVNILACCHSCDQHRTLPL